MGQKNPPENLTKIKIKSQGFNRHCVYGVTLLLTILGFAVCFLYYECTDQSIKATTWSHLLNFIIPAFLSFIPAVLLTWRIDYMNSKLENDYYRTLRRFRLHGVLHSVFAIYTRYVFTLQNKVNEDEKLSWDEWHLRVLSFIKEGSIEARELQISLEKLGDKLNEKILHIQDPHYEGDAITHKLFDKQDTDALIDLQMALEKGYCKNHEDFYTFMKQAIDGLPELSFLSTPFGREGLRGRGWIE